MNSSGRSCLLQLLGFACAGAFFLSGITALAGQAPAAIANAGPRDLTGTWQGMWRRAECDTRTSISILKTADGWAGKLYLVDQPGLGVNLSRVSLQGSTFRYASTRGTAGSYEGTLSSDGNTIKGFWTEDAGPRELNLTRVNPETSRTPAWKIRTATPDQLHYYLDASYRRSLLVAESTPPFRLIAQVDFFQHGKPVPINHAILDELWHAPLSWKLTVTYGSSTFTEVDNGTTAYTTGAIAKAPASDREPEWVSVGNTLLHAEAALFSPFSPALLATRHLTLGNEPCQDQTPKGKQEEDLPECACIDAEPNLAGVPSTVPLAKTAYCFSPGDLILHKADYPSGSPDGYVVSFYDIAPFGSNEIARTIDISQNGLLLARMHIAFLAVTTDFSALSVPAPAGAKTGKAHRQDAMIDQEIMLGQPIYTSFDLLQTKMNSSAGKITELILNLHIDAKGRATLTKVLGDPKHLMTPVAAEAVKKWKYRISYQGDHAVAIDRSVSIPVQ
jgi:hypothetical protein